MNRSDLQRLSEMRLRESKILLAAEEYSGAYYLGGYAVECGLKACFAKTVHQYDFPDKDRAGRVFIHRFKDLARLALLDNELAHAQDNEKGFFANWLRVCVWTEDSRYSIWSEAKARGLLNSIDHDEDGVMPWIRLRW